MAPVALSHALSLSVVLYRSALFSWHWVSDLRFYVSKITETMCCLPGSDEQNMALHDII